MSLDSVIKKLGTEELESRVAGHELKSCEEGGAYENSNVQLDLPGQINGGRGGRGVCICEYKSRMVHNSV